MEKKVLILDDDSALLDMLSEALTGEGYAVKVTDRYDHLFTITKDFYPDIIILDYLLHGVNGGELCHLLKQDPETKNLPVVIISAYPRVILSLGLYGCDEFIPKPFDLYSFIKKIDHYTSHPLFHSL